MKKIYLLFISNVFGAGLIAQSPITLGNSNMPGNGDTLRYTNVQINSVGNYVQTGTNFTWNFSNVVSLNEDVRSFKNAIQTPYALFFLALGEYGEKVADTLGAGPLTITKYYNYYKKQTSPPAFIADGVGMTFSNVPVPSYYSDRDELYNFPMSYPKYDSTTFKFKSGASSLLPFVYIKTGYRVTTVDGWGTVTTPYGTENCLRLVTTQYAMDSIINTIIPIPIGFPNYQRSYQWMTLTSKIPYFEVTGNLIGNNFTPTQVRYRGRDLTTNATGIKNEINAAEIQIYPNPVENTLTLGEFNGTCDIEISTLDGKFIRKESLTSPERKVLDVNELKAGVYILKINSETKTDYYKFIKL